MTAWTEAEHLSSKSLADFKHGGRSYLFKHGTEAQAVAFNTDDASLVPVHAKRSTVIMLYKATMSDIDTDLRPQAAVYIGQPVGDVTVSADQVPIYPLQFLPYTMCPVTPACPANVAALNSCFKSFCKGRLAAGSATCFSSLGPAQFVQTVAEWNQWKGSIDAVVADVAADPGKWNMAELMEVGLLIGESHADAEVARGISDQALQTAALFSCGASLPMQGR